MGNWGSHETYSQYSDVLSPIVRRDSACTGQPVVLLYPKSNRLILFSSPIGLGSPQNTLPSWGAAVPVLPPQERSLSSPAQWDRHMEPRWARQMAVFSFPGFPGFPGASTETFAEGVPTDPAVGVPEPRADWLGDTSGL